MCDYKVVFDCSDDCFSNISPSKIPDIMNNLTNGNGELYVREWTDNFDPVPTLYKCNTDWTNKNKVNDSIKTIYRSLKKIDQISKDIIEEAKDINEDWMYTESSDCDEKLEEDLIERLDGDLLDFYNTFLSSWDYSDECIDEYQLSEIIQKDILGMDLTDEEQEIYDAANELKKRDILSRIQEGPSCFDVVVRIKRIYRLMQLNAPAIMINNEWRHLSVALVIYLCANKKEKIDNIL